jgi:hypothetical protein
MQALIDYIDVNRVVSKKIWRFRSNYIGSIGLISGECGGYLRI